MWGVVGHIYNPSTGDTEEGGLRVKATWSTREDSESKKTKKTPKQTKTDKGLKLVFSSPKGKTGNKDFSKYIQLGRTHKLKIKVGNMS
jgi:hypothetical protein